DPPGALPLPPPRGPPPPPVLLRPPRAVRHMTALFHGLDILPAYGEADVSLPFFIFFSIFFAMLVGDGGYGLLTLALALWGWRKAKRTPPARAPFILLTVFALATVTWGALTNSWFGFHPPLLDNPASRRLTAPGTGDGLIMLICFTLGAIHLSLARIWNAVLLFPSTKCLAQVGWVGVILFMYFFAGSIVGVLDIPPVMKPVLGVSILLIVLFMLKKDELKTNGVDLGMLPLVIIGCLGDMISYIRLFAVGLAGAKVAENFNAMATGMDWPLYLKIIPMLLILLVGHALNFAMAGLGVLVHAVRLNTLEFSSHKGVSWSGIRFNPFRRTAVED
ncbi:MAG: V-type ATP synthase subunit I, partial [Kiritimatiellaeota bacterium]|nr:V-type ATP synthase subunit I [Kiritimatiellota bacterium]